jgi:catechol 2,3-dioxygenase-like lactoylglutathione lyase family enzyme
MTWPLPSLDHVVVNARENLSAAAACYRRLGFHLTPLGRHTIGSMNHLAIFAADYLELVGFEAGSAAARGDLLRSPAGLDGLVFATEDADSVHSAMAEAGVATGEVGEFSRPVELASGAADARFRVVRLTPEAVPYGRVYFCQHLTRPLVWRDEWRLHPNGAVGVARAVIAAADPDSTTELYRRMFGAAAVRPIDGGFSLTVGLSRFDIITPATLETQFGTAAPAMDGRPVRMAALTFRTLSLAQAGSALEQGGIAFDRRSDRILVAACDAFGAALEFIA